MIGRPPASQRSCVQIKKMVEIFSHKYPNMPHEHVFNLQEQIINLRRKVEAAGFEPRLYYADINK